MENSNCKPVEAKSAINKNPSAFDELYQKLDDSTYSTLCLANGLLTIIERLRSFEEKEVNETPSIPIPNNSGFYGAFQDKIMRVQETNRVLLKITNHLEGLLGVS